MARRPTREIQDRRLPLPLVQAREIFNRDYATVILKGRSIKVARDTRPGTVGDVFDGYIQFLKDTTKSSWREADEGLNSRRHARPQSACAISPPTMDSM
jgi:hypothetical protein